MWFAVGAPVGEGARVKAGPFRYVAPGSRAEVAELLQEHGDEAVLLAGGQSLVPMMNLRLVLSDVVIDLNRIRERDYVEARADHVAVGALARHRRVERCEPVEAQVPLLAAAMTYVGHPAVRARGTVCGSVAHADPAAEVGCVLVASEGTVILESLKGAREAPAAAFFRGPYWTDRQPDEFVSEVRFPVAKPGTAIAFRELVRKDGDFALVLVAVQLEIDGDRCAGARIAVGGAGPVPRRCHAAEAILAGSRLDRETLAGAAEAAGDEVEPTGDVHGSAYYRRRIARVEVGRALADAATKAETVQVRNG
jgi:CO/xanthine dehydrogenase FAD-binding subunit